MNTVLPQQARTGKQQPTRGGRQPRRHAYQNTAPSGTPNKAANKVASKAPGCQSYENTSPDSAGRMPHKLPSGPTPRGTHTSEDTEQKLASHAAKGASAGHSYENSSLLPPVAREASREVVAGGSAVRDVATTIVVSSNNISFAIPTASGARALGAQIESPSWRLAREVGELAHGHEVHA